MKIRNSLVAAADKARNDAYAPYSGFKVGVAVLSSDGRVFTGANVENASFGATICAERVAVASAVAAGARSFDLIAVVTGEALPVFPCGICRQFLSEFGDMEIICTGTSGKIVSTRLKDLIPNAFSYKGRVTAGEMKKTSGRAAKK